MAYKIVFLDIDGTILKPDHTYHPKSKEAIKQAQAKGMEVVLATGRPIHEIHHLAEEFNITTYIGYNGAYALYQGMNILDAPMKQEIVVDYLRIAREHQHELILYTSENSFVSSIESPVMSEFKDMFQIKHLQPINEEMTKYVLGITLVNVQPEEVHLYAIDDDIRLAQVNIEGAENCFDVIRKSVNKGEAVKVLLNHLNIPTEPAVAFGDGLNDKEMLETVGAGFAMGNASPELFRSAKYKTKTVTEAGIYYGLQQLGVVE